MDGAGAASAASAASADSTNTSALSWGSSQPLPPLAEGALDALESLIAAFADEEEHSAAPAQAGPPSDAAAASSPSIVEQASSRKDEPLPSDKVAESNDAMGSSMGHRATSSRLTAAFAFPSLTHKPHAPPVNLSDWDLPQWIVSSYASAHGIRALYPWQAQCLSTPGVLLDMQKPVPVAVDVRDGAVVRRLDPQEMPSAHSTVTAPAAASCSSSALQAVATPAVGSSSSVSSSTAMQPPAVLPGEPLFTSPRWLLYCAPTSGGKSLVAEVVMLRRLFRQQPVRAGQLPPLPDLSASATSVAIAASVAAMPTGAPAAAAGATSAPQQQPQQQPQHLRTKALVVLPFRALVDERVTYLDKLLNPHGAAAAAGGIAAAFRPRRIGVIGLSGGKSAPPGAVASARVIVCTIERASGVINEMVANGSICSLCCVVVDELHVLGERGRGAKLEQLLTKLKLLTSGRYETPPPPHASSLTGRKAFVRAPPATAAPSCSGPSRCDLQVVGMSATLPNLPQIARWLGSSLFMTQFRPVPLKEYLKVDSSIFLVRDNGEVVVQQPLQQSSGAATAQKSGASNAPSKPGAQPTAQPAARTARNAKAAQPPPPTSAFAAKPSSSSDGQLPSVGASLQHDLQLSRSRGLPPKGVPCPPDTDHVVFLAAEMVAEGSQAIVFSPTKAGTEATARLLARHLDDAVRFIKDFQRKSAATATSVAGVSGTSAATSAASSSNTDLAAAAKQRARVERVQRQRLQMIERLRTQAGRSNVFTSSPLSSSSSSNSAPADTPLMAAIRRGVAFHNADLTPLENEVVVQGFRRAAIDVIVATSTLAAGVNLPAKRVIFTSPHIGPEPLDLVRYRQMAGRAGRAGPSGASSSYGESIVVIGGGDHMSGRPLKPHAILQRASEAVRMIRSEMRPADSQLVGLVSSSVPSQHQQQDGQAPSVGTAAASSSATSASPVPAAPSSAPSSSQLPNFHGGEGGGVSEMLLEAIVVGYATHRSSLHALLAASFHVHQRAEADAAASAGPSSSSVSIGASASGAPAVAQTDAALHASAYALAEHTLIFLLRERLIAIRKPVLRPAVLSSSAGNVGATTATSSSSVAVPQPQGPDHWFEPTELGRAACTSFMEPAQAVKVYFELQRARRRMLLADDLHALYCVTPFIQPPPYPPWASRTTRSKQQASDYDSGNGDGDDDGQEVRIPSFWAVYNGLGDDERRIAEAVGIEPLLLQRAAVSKGYAVKPGVRFKRINKGNIEAAGASALPTSVSATIGVGASSAAANSAGGTPALATASPPARRASAAPSSAAASAATSSAGSGGGFFLPGSTPTAVASASAGRGGGSSSVDGVGGSSPAVLMEPVDVPPVSRPSSAMIPPVPKASSNSSDSSGQALAGQAQVVTAAAAPAPASAVPDEPDVLNAREVAIHTRFWHALLLKWSTQGLTSEAIEARYDVRAADLRKLLSEAEGFSAKVARFAAELHWPALARIAAEAHARIACKWRGRGMAFMKGLPAVTYPRALALATAGFASLADLAAADPATVGAVLVAARPFQQQAFVSDDEEKDGVGAAAAASPASSAGGASGRNKRPGSSAAASNQTSVLASSEDAERRAAYVVVQGARAKLESSLHKRLSHAAASATAGGGWAGIASGRIGGLSDSDFTSYTVQQRAPASFSSSSSSRSEVSASIPASAACAAAPSAAASSLGMTLPSVESAYEACMQTGDVSDVAEVAALHRAAKRRRTQLEAVQAERDAREAIATGAAAAAASGGAIGIGRGSSVLTLGLPASVGGFSASINYAPSSAGAGANSSANGGGNMPLAEEELEALLAENDEGDGWLQSSGGEGASAAREARADGDDYDEQEWPSFEPGDEDVLMGLDLAVDEEAEAAQREMEDDDDIDDDEDEDTHTMVSSAGSAKRSAAASPGAASEPAGAGPKPASVPTTADAAAAEAPAQARVPAAASSDDQQPLDEEPAFHLDSMSQQELEEAVLQVQAVALQPLAVSVVRADARGNVAVVTSPFSLASARRAGAGSASATSAGSHLTSSAYRRPSPVNQPVWPNTGAKAANAGASAMERSASGLSSSSSAPVPSALNDSENRLRSHRQKASPMQPLQSLSSPVDALAAAAQAVLPSAVVDATSGSEAAAAAPSLPFLTSSPLDLSGVSSIAMVDEDEGAPPPAEGIAIIAPPGPNGASSRRRLSAGSGTVGSGNRRETRSRTAAVADSTAPRSSLSATAGVTGSAIKTRAAHKRKRAAVEATADAKSRDASPAASSGGKVMPARQRSSAARSVADSGGAAEANDSTSSSSSAPQLARLSVSFADEHMLQHDSAASIPPAATETDASLSSPAASSSSFHASSGVKHVRFVVEFPVTRAAHVTLIEPELQNDDDQAGASFARPSEAPPANSSTAAPIEAAVASTTEDDTDNHEHDAAEANLSISAPAPAPSALERAAMEGALQRAHPPSAADGNIDSSGGPASGSFVSPPDPPPQLMMMQADLPPPPLCIALPFPSPGSNSNVIRSAAASAAIIEAAQSVQGEPACSRIDAAGPSQPTSGSSVGAPSASGSGGFLLLQSYSAAAAAPGPEAAAAAAPGGANNGAFGAFIDDPDVDEWFRTYVSPERVAPPASAALKASPPVQPSSEAASGTLPATSPPDSISSQRDAPFPADGKVNLQQPMQQRETSEQNVRTLTDTSSAQQAPAADTVAVAPDVTSLPSPSSAVAGVPASPNRNRAPTLSYPITSGLEALYAASAAEDSGPPLTSAAAQPSSSSSAAAAALASASIPPSPPCLSSRMPHEAQTASSSIWSSLASSIRPHDTETADALAIWRGIPSFCLHVVTEHTPHLSPHRWSGLWEGARTGRYGREEDIGASDGLSPPTTTPAASASQLAGTYSLFSDALGGTIGSGNCVAPFTGPCVVTGLAISWGGQAHQAFFLPLPPLLPAPPASWRALRSKSTAEKVERVRQMQQQQQLIRATSAVTSAALGANFTSVSSSTVNGMPQRHPQDAITSVPRAFVAAVTSAPNPARSPTKPPSASHLPPSPPLTSQLPHDVMVLIMLYAGVRKGCFAARNASSPPVSVLLFDELFEPDVSSPAVAYPFAPHSDGLPYNSMHVQVQSEASAAANMQPFTAASAAAAAPHGSGPSGDYRLVPNAAPSACKAWFAAYADAQRLLWERRVRPAWHAVASALSNPASVKVMWDAKGCINALTRCGVTVEGEMADPAVAAWLLHPEARTAIKPSGRKAHSSSSAAAVGVSAAGDDDSSDSKGPALFELLRSEYMSEPYLTKACEEVAKVTSVVRAQLAKAAAAASPPPAVAASAGVTSISTNAPPAASSSAAAAVSGVRPLASPSVSASSSSSGGPSSSPLSSSLMALAGKAPERLLYLLLDPGLLSSASSPHSAGNGATASLSPLAAAADRPSLRRFVGEVRTWAGRQIAVLKGEADENGGDDRNGKRRRRDDDNDVRGSRQSPAAAPELVSLAQRLGVPPSHLTGLGAGRHSSASSSSSARSNYAPASASEDALRCCRYSWVLMCSLSVLLRRYRLDRSFRFIEMPLAPVLAELECYGIGSQSHVLRKSTALFRERIEVLRQALRQLAHLAAVAQQQADAAAAMTGAGAGAGGVGTDACQQPRFQLDSAVGLARLIYGHYRLPVPAEVRKALGADVSDSSNSAVDLTSLAARSAGALVRDEVLCAAIAEAEATLSSSSSSSAAPSGSSDSSPLLSRGILFSRLFMEHRSLQFSFARHVAPLTRAVTSGVTRPDPLLGGQRSRVKPQLNYHTSTGRLTVTKPALQQTPKELTIARVARLSLHDEMTSGTGLVQVRRIGAAGGCGSRGRRGKRFKRKRGFGGFHTGNDGLDGDDDEEEDELDLLDLETALSQPAHSKCLIVAARQSLVATLQQHRQMKQIEGPSTAPGNDSAFPAVVPTIPRATVIASRIGHVTAIHHRRSLLDLSADQVVMSANGSASGAAPTATSSSAAATAASTSPLSADAASAAPAAVSSAPAAAWLSTNTGSGVDPAAAHIERILSAGPGSFNPASDPLVAYWRKCGFPYSDERAAAVSQVSVSARAPPKPSNNGSDGDPFAEMASSQHGAAAAAEGGDLPLATFHYPADKVYRLTAPLYLPPPSHAAGAGGQYPWSSPETLNLRDAFVASPGYVLLGADYSQVELRVMAHFSGDAGLVRAFASGQDVFRTIAAQWRSRGGQLNRKKKGAPQSSCGGDGAGAAGGMSEGGSTPVQASAVGGDVDMAEAEGEFSPADVREEERNRAKALVYALCYGMGLRSLAAKLGLPVQEARGLVTAFNRAFPSLSRFLNGVALSAQRQGYVDTLFGRRRMLPDVYSQDPAVRSAAQRQAVNTVCQGTAADLIKLAMSNIRVKLQQLHHQQQQQLQMVVAAEERAVDGEGGGESTAMTSDSLQLKVVVDSAAALHSMDMPLKPCHSQHSEVSAEEDAARSSHDTASQLAANAIVGGLSSTTKAAASESDLTTSSASSAQKQKLKRPPPATAQLLVNTATGLPPVLPPPARIVLQIHDELLLEVREDLLLEVADIVRVCMQDSTTLSVPLHVKLSVGKRWGSLKLLH